MRSLKVKQYKYRLEQFMKTFKTIFPDDSPEYEIELRNAFKKSLNEDGILMPDWI